MTESAQEEELVNDDELLFDRAFSALPELDAVGPATVRPQMPPLPRHTPPPPRLPDSRFSRPRDEAGLRPGDMVAGKYQVERVAGRSGAAIVAHVRHAELGQPFLLKYLANDACSVPDAVSRFLRGARLAMRLQSEHTARTIDAGRLASGAPYIVTESYPGSDLREVLRVRGILTLTESVDFILQAAESVAEAHAQGLIHKNLNPNTLFATRRPDGSAQIKVQDFGVADALRPDPMRLGSFGNDTDSGFDSNPTLDGLSCLAPEQIRGSTEVDERADIWALAAILQHILSGRPVHDAGTLTGLLASIVADPPTPITSLRSDVPAGLEVVILRGLAKDRGARFASLADFAAALKSFASPDAQGTADRITRTLGRNGQSLPLSGAASAMVHVGPAANKSASAASVAGKPHAAVVRYPLVWSTLLVAFGLVGGTIAGVLVATRQPPQPALEQRIAAQQPDQTELLPPPVAAPEPSASAKPVAPPRVVVSRVAQRPPAKAPRTEASEAIDTSDLPPAKEAAPPAKASAKEATPPASSRSAKANSANSAATADLANDLFGSVR